MDTKAHSYSPQSHFGHSFLVCVWTLQPSISHTVATCHWPVSHPGYSDGGHLGSVDVLYQLPNLSSGENTMDWSIINE